MSLRNTENSWGLVTQLLHWLTLALIVWMAWLGLTMVDMPSTPAKIATYALHKSVGITVLWLVVIRIVWRLWAGAPRAVPGTPMWQVRIADGTHVAIYMLLLLMPLSGWLLNSALGYPLRWFTLFSIPPLAQPDETLGSVATQVHEWGFWMLVLLVALHAGAAFYHHLFQGDDTFRRMLPGYRPPGEKAPR